MRRALVSALVALTAVVTWSVAAPPPAFAAPGDTWTARSTPQSSWRSVAYNGTVYVAVADGGGDRVMTSFNGTAWTPQTAAEPNSWRSVTWIGGTVNLFVAVASDGTNRVMTSPDGEVWTARAAPAGAWTSVATKTSTNDLLVAVADNDTSRVMTSPDGISWTAQVAAENNAWTSVTWGTADARFVAVAAGGTNRVMTSPDGVTWTAQAAAAASSWSSVAYDGSVFVAVSRDGANRVMTSPDGLAPWTIQTDADAGASTWTSLVSFGAADFLAVSSGGTHRVMRSTDSGVTWAPADTGAPSNAWQSVVYNGSTKYVAVALSGDIDRVMTSADGTSWAGGPAAANSWQSVTFGEGLFVAVASDGTQNRVMTSPDGITWTLRAAAEANEWTSVTYGNGQFVAVAVSGTNRVMTSPDGITWSPQQAAAANQWWSVTFGANKFVAVSNNGADRVMTSPDGENWTLSSDAITTDDGAWASVTWGGGAFVAVGPGLAVISSSDGVDWDTHTAPAGQNWISVTHGGAAFVAVSYNQPDRVMTSPDGVTWAFSGDTTDTPADTWQAVTYGAGTFVATGTSKVMTSTNRTDWTTFGSAEDNHWLSVTYANGLFVAVADEGTHRIMTSGTFTPPAPPTNPPTITSFTPTSGPVGTTVVITGTNFVDGDTRVFFDGVEATDVMVDSPTRITVVVPDGATTGPIGVTTGDGSAVSADDFTVTVEPEAIRIWGQDELDTAIAVSQHAFPDDGSAAAVVLARSDWFADALAGGPLAATVSGPLLLTDGAPTTRGDDISPKVLAEIERVLDPTDTVYVLGGELAISAGVQDDLVAAGYTVVRLAGANQFATAVAIADEIGTPSNVLEATGWNFPDALSAVPAAIRIDGVILLTDDDVQAPETQAYIDAHPGVPRYTIGGSLVAGSADPGAVNVSGPDLYGTSAKVALKWFLAPDEFGIATGNAFPDALSGGVFMATGDRMGPMLLVNGRSTPVPPAIAAYLGILDPGTTGYAFGGTIAISTAVLDAVMAAVGP